MEIPRFRMDNSSSFADSRHQHATRPNTARVWPAVALPLPQRRQCQEPRR